MSKKADEKQKSMEAKVAAAKEAFAAAMSKNNLVERYQGLMTLQAQSETLLESAAIPHPAVPVGYLGGLGGLLALVADSGAILSNTPLGLGVMGVSAVALLTGFAMQEDAYVPKKLRAYEAARESLIEEMQSEINHILAYDIAKMSKQKGFRELMKSSESVRKAFDRAAKGEALSAPSMPADKKKLEL